MRKGPENDMGRLEELKINLQPQKEIVGKIRVDYSNSLFVLVTGYLLWCLRVMDV